MQGFKDISIDISIMTFPCVMKVINVTTTVKNVISALLYILFISLHFSAFLYISLNFS